MAGDFLPKVQMLWLWLSLSVIACSLPSIRGLPVNCYTKLPEGRKSVIFGETIWALIRPSRSATQHSFTWRSLRIGTACVVTRGSHHACDRWRFLRPPMTTSATKSAPVRSTHSSVGSAVFSDSISHREISPVVYTCGVSVLQELRRTKAVLGGS